MSELGRNATPAPTQMAPPLRYPGELTNLFYAQTPEEWARLVTIMNRERSRADALHQEDV